MAQSIRNSTGKLKATSKGVDNGPNYLRASTGSCHDVCKYGTPHEFKPKPKRPVRRSSTSNAEIPIEIFTPSDKKSAKAVKSSSVAPDASVSTKLEAAVSGRSASIGVPKSVRQQASSSTKVSSSLVSKQIGQGSPLDVKSLSPDVSDLIKQESSLDVKSLSPDLSNLDKQESSLDVNSLSPDSSESVHKRDSSFVEQASSPESSTSIKQESSLDVRSSPPNPLISVKQESSSDVKSPSIPSIKKGSSSQRQSRTSASKSTIQDVQSRRKSSLSQMSGLSVGQSASKPTRYSLHLTPGSTSKTSVVGRKSSLLDASKFVKPEASSSRVKAPLKNGTSTKLVGVSLKSKSNRARTEQSSPSNMLGSKSGDGSNGKINSGSKIGTESRTSKAASKKIMDSTTTSLPLKTRKSLASSSVALTPNLPGTKVARLNVRSSITKEEGSSSGRKPEASSLSSSSRKPEKEKVPEKTLHMIEMETSNQQSPGSFDSLCQSKSAFSSQDAIETDSESEYTDSEADDTVSSYRRGSGKGRVLDNESAAVKLKFRRGKVVDLESEANSPRRLRFRRKSISEDDRSVENEMKVVLRHQDLQEKRSEKGLLNVVIEETASKLEETRKSKVKALVGAFESVISLQESKPSPNLSPGR